MRGLCRDCLADFEQPDGSGVSCPACGGGRLVAHSERDSLSIAHVDCDAFYASVEKRDNPALAEQPVIVGGGRRGVVMTCCYVARRFGVRSAMPMFKALAACPQAVIVKPDMEKYASVGREIRSRMLDLTPAVEPLSIDEAFLDLTGTERLFEASPAQTLARFQQQIERNIGITVSIGLSHNKFLAKIASDFEKPRGFSIIGRAETLAFLEDKSVGIFFGVGQVALRRLARDGIRVVADLRAIGAEEMHRRYGSEGDRLFRLAHGIDARQITPTRKSKSISCETTFDADLKGLDALEPVLWRLAEKVADRLRKAELGAASMTLKMKTHDFEIRTRARTLPPTQLAIRLFETALDLLRREPVHLKFRLLGIGVAQFSPASEADKGDLVDTRSIREAKAARAIGALRDKFGDQAIVRGPAARR